tara:strand:- start:278 stop:631 length:354 start_codon:yes stop_codon:yes gene_type:complete
MTPDFPEVPETLEETDLKQSVAHEETENEIIDEGNPESLIDALAKCGLFSRETSYIPNILRFDDNIFNEEYYRKRHGDAFPDSWYKIMAEVSKKKFEDLRNNARQMESLGAKTVTWD